MNQDMINKYIKEAHENAKDKGFYDCPVCLKNKFEFTDICPKCKGTGINPNKNIGELLMLIVSELGEALEAHRKNKYAYLDTIVNHDKFFNPECGITKEKSLERIFERDIKDTFEDEIADVFIRLFDLCGYLDVKYIDILPVPEMEWKSNNTAQQIRQLAKYFDNLDEDNLTNFDLIKGIYRVAEFANLYKIDIEKHIQLKMVYNKTRPRKHGEEY